MENEKVSVGLIIHEDIRFRRIVSGVLRQIRYRATDCSSAAPVSIAGLDAFMRDSLQPPLSGWDTPDYEYWRWMYDRFRSDADVFVLRSGTEVPADQCDANWLIQYAILCLWLDGQIVTMTRSSDGARSLCYIYYQRLYQPGFSLVKPFGLHDTLQQELVRADGLAKLGLM